MAYQLPFFNHLLWVFLLFPNFLMLQCPGLHLLIYFHPFWAHCIPWGFKNYLYVNNFQYISSLDLFPKLQTCISNLSKTELLIFQPSPPSSSTSYFSCHSWCLRPRTLAWLLFFITTCSPSAKTVALQNKCRIWLLLTTTISYCFYPGPSHHLLLRLPQ